MKLTIPVVTAKAIFDELECLPTMTQAQTELFNLLKPFCQVNLEWHPTGYKQLPTISGVGWAAKYLANPSDSDEPETSIYDAEAAQSYVLRGDHREAFQKAAVDGLPALLALYEELKKNPNYAQDH